MMDLDVVFDRPQWEMVIDTIRSGSNLSASRFLAMMESEPEDALEEALERLEEKNILLDISTLPMDKGNGETALRLRQEAQLVKAGNLPGGLEENDPLRLYLEELALIPAFGDAQLLAERCLAGDEEAQSLLTNRMLSLVVERAFELTGRGVLLLDLIQEGSLGLWQAILNYAGGDFESYCDHCIRATLAKTVTLQARASGVGQKMRQAVEDYRAADQRLLTQLGRNPTLEEVAVELGMTPEEAAAVAETMDAARLVSRAKGEEKQEQIPQEEDQAVEDTAYFQMRQRISELLSSLEEEDAKLLTLRFGLEGGLPLSPAETGKKLNLTPDEVVQREAAALMKLRSNG